METLPASCAQENPIRLPHDPSAFGTPVWFRRFIGRANELHSLNVARRALGRGRGSLALIDGEAGIGKSRLVEQFLHAVGGGRASRVVTVECVPESNAELWPIRNALMRLWSSTITDAPALVLRTVAQLIPDVAGDEVTARYAGAPLGNAELFAGLTAAFALACAKRGAIVVVEDVHWADRASLAFLAALAPQIESMRLLLIATARSEVFERSDEFADVVSRLMRARGFARIALHPLERDELADLIDGALAGRAQLPAATIGEIIGRCEGNPFFAEELVRAAVDARASGSVALPSSIRASIRHRLSTLGPAERAMLEVAAVLGVRFNHHMLAELTDLPHAAVLRMLRDARAAAVIDDAGGDSCRFHHTLTRETIYQSLLGAEVRALHGRILTLLEAQPDAERQSDLLAYHAWEAGEREAALRYSESAGAVAADRGLYAEARTYFERALEGAAAANDRARLFERIGTVAKARGDFAAAIAALTSALALRTANGEFDDAARIAVAVAVEQSNSGADPVAELEAFLAIYGGRLGASARDTVLVFLARLMTSYGDFARAETLLRDTSAPARLEPRVRANYLTCRLNMAEHAGTVAAWRDAADHMLLLAPELPPLMRAIALTTVAQTGAWFGERRVAQTALHDAQRLAGEWGFDALLAFSRAVESQLCYLAGDLAGASVALEAVGRRPDVVPAQILAARVGPYVAYALGDRQMVARCLDNAAVRAALAGGDDEDRLYDAAARLAPGRPPLSDPWHDVLAARLAAFADGAFFTPRVALVAAERLDLGLLPELCRAAAAASARAAGNVVAAAVCDLVVAIAGSRSGAADCERARRAADAFALLPWPLFEMTARTYAGEREQAHAIAERCGAVADAERLRSAARPAERPAPAEPASLLSARERDIAARVAAGATNAQIAQQLSIGIKTVEKHVSSILLKLAARSRAQIAAYIVARDGADGAE